ncbi:MAG: competence protein ComEC family protein [Oscillospiraceae bacterium]|nr:competence protein ComEC family protein [Oscillospiraceae bacterium]
MKGGDKAAATKSRHFAPLLKVRNKAAVAGFSYFAGLLVSECVGVVGAAFMCAVLVPFALAAARGLPAVSAALLFSGAGALVSAVYGVNTVMPALSSDGRSVALTGVITDKKEYPGDLAAYTVKTEIDGVFVKVQTLTQDVAAKYGDTVAFEAKLYVLRDNGLFPERSYNYSRGILLGAQARSAVEIKKTAAETPVGSIRKYSGYIRGKIMAAFPGDTGGLLCAVFLGDTSLMSPELDSAIRISGTSHYTAVSGLHLTLISHFVLLGTGLTPLRNKRTAKFLLLLGIIVVFTVFFDMSKSVVRAALMLVVCYGGELFMRRGCVFNSLGFALGLILLFEPYACLDAGLILSVAGTFGVGVVAPALTRRRVSRLSETLVAACCASLCVLPAAAIYFKGMSALSPVTSVVLAPFFSVAAVALILFAAFGGHGGIFLFAAGVMSQAMTRIIEFFGGFKPAWVNLDYAFVPFWVIFAALAVGAVRLVYKDAAKTAKSAVLSVCALAVMICSYNAFAAGRTYVEVRSDGTAGWLVARRGNTLAVVATADSPKAYAEINALGGDITLLCLLGSANNAATLYEGLPCVKYVPPGSPGALYDISGDFTLETREGEATLTVGDYTVALSPAKNPRAARADLVVAYGRVKNRREMNSETTVYVNRGMDALDAGEINAYYGNAKFIVGG